MHDAPSRGERRRGGARSLGPLLVLVLVLLLVRTVAPAAAQETVRYTTADGFEIVAHSYRPDSASTRAVLILPNLEEGKEAWVRIGERLRAAGFYTLVPDPRGTGESRLQRGLRRDRDTFTSRERVAAVMDGLAGLRYLLDLPAAGIDTVALIGSGSGVSSALKAASASRGPSACLFVSPRGELGEEETARLEGPLLIVVGKDDLLGIDATGKLLAEDPVRECWIVDGRGLGAELLESRMDLITLWIEWIARALGKARTDR